ncbi:MAG: phosphoribosylglycinamide formyltransferase [Bacteroidales bacterium]|jgi:phosphoribosylglycinamide formyltransferase-1|nr:phosphoribosylglycinamide formyltransferase [Bacteroidales bacterium]
MIQNKIKRIAIFASGNGSNAQRIAEYFADNANVEIALILSNKKDAFVLERAKTLQIPAFYFPKSQFLSGKDIIALLESYQIDLIVLAGFLLLIPKSIIDAFPNQIVNIHPALLPKYGGKGMFGNHVHEAVITSNEKESGITIHFVNEKYDDGTYIFQATCDISPTDTPDSLAQKIHALEHEHLPKIIEKLLFIE